MSKIYLVIYDNCEEFEDRWEKTICGCVDLNNATKLVIELNKWIKDARANKPENWLESELYRTGKITDEEIKSFEARESEYFAQLTPPYGFTIILDAVDEFGYARGFVKMAEVELFTK